MNFLDKAAGFLRSQLSESDGSASNTRVCIFLVIAFALGWITALVTKVKAPVTVREIGDMMGPLGMFVGTICADVQNNRTAAGKPGVSGQ